MSIDELTLAGVVRAKADRQDPEPVLTIEGGGKRDDETRSFAQLWRNGQALARGLKSLGLGRGEKFALLMANHVEFVDAMVAAGILDALFVPIDPRTKGDKLAYMLKAAGSVGVIAADYALDNLNGVRGELEDLRWVVAMPTDESDKSLADEPAITPLAEVMDFDGAELPIAIEDPQGAMQLIYTSGTTGDPKGIIMTHARFCGTAAAAGQLFKYTTDDRPYSGLSLTHANAQLVTLAATLILDMHCVLSRRFTKSRLWDITRQYGCTTFTLLGGMTTAVYAEPRRPNDADNPVRFIVSAGMPKAIWEDFEQRFGVRILEFYGAAEGGLVVNPVGVGPVGSVGKVAPILQYKIVDENDNEVAPGESGELLMRHADGSPFVVEYYGKPEASAAKCAGGWLRMGDVLHEDENGWLYFEYRKGGGIRCNGDFVNPAFVEKVIAEQDAVDDVFVYGVTAASGAPGEKDVVAAVVPSNGSLDPQALFQACREKLESNFVPRYIQIMDAIPKTASEKPQERFCVEAFENDKAQVVTEARH